MSDSEKINVVRYKVDQNIDALRELLTAWQMHGRHVEYHEGIGQMMSEMASIRNWLQSIMRDLRQEEFASRGGKRRHAAPTAGAGRSRVKRIRATARGL